MPKQKPCVLFSPIGKTDPARDYFDGPFLHILRHYPVKKAVLYLTKETFESENEDHRFTVMAELVRPGVEYELTGDPELEDVYRFEIYDEPFREALEKLHRENPDCDLLVNISSGTPQMEASLYLLKAVLPFPIRAIQVTTPQKRSNDTDHLKDFDAILFHMLEDNKPDAKNRCIEVDNENVRAAILKKNILALAKGFNYTAALVLAQEAGELLAPECLKLLEAAKLRLSLRTDGALRMLGAAGNPYFEERSEAYRAIYEYLLMLDTLIAREAYGDYARAISPALVGLLRIALQCAGGLDVDQLCERDARNGAWYIRRTRIEAHDPALLAYLDLQYDGCMRDAPLGADAMLHMLRYACQQTGAAVDLPAFEAMRSFERQVRNCAAHQNTPITDAQIRQWTSDRANAKGFGAKDMQTMMKDAFAQLARPQGSDYAWNGYARMNKAIAQYL